MAARLAGRRDVSTRSPNPATTSPTRSAATRSSPCAAIDGVVRVFYNVCQHRGNRLVTAEVGSLLAGEFQCAYHGWRFGSRRPAQLGSRRGRLPRRAARAACATSSRCRRDTWAGFIWFNMDPDAAPLREWLDPVADHLDVYRMERHEAHALGDGRGRLQLEVRAGQLQRELPPALRAPADARVDERAPQRLPVRPVPVRPRPDAHARRRARPAVPGQAGADDQEPRTRSRVLGARPRAVPRRPAVAAHRAAAAQARTRRVEGVRLLARTPTSS